MRLLGQKNCVPCLLLACLLLSSCGPEEPPLAMALEDEHESRDRWGPPAEHMRYPLAGSDANQRLLYQFNRLEAVRLREHAVQMRLRSGAAREQQPKERSPFLE